MSEDDEQPVDGDTLTVLQRLRVAGISESRALHHLRMEYVHVDGQVVTDSAAPASRPARVVLRPRT